MKIKIIPRPSNNNLCKDILKILSSIYDAVAWERRYRLKATNYFHKKLHLRRLTGPGYASV